MSDVLVKNMKMPEGCVECPLLLAYESRLENKTIHHCMGRLPEDSRFSDDADLTKRPKEGCPLVEVKPHGRVIDVDAFIESEKGRMVSVHEADATAIRELYGRITNAPTVLGANDVF